MGEIFFAPSQDGWDTEAVSSELQASLKEIVSSALKNEELEHPFLTSKSLGPEFSEELFEIFGKTKSENSRSRRLEPSRLPLEGTIPFSKSLMRVLSPLQTQHDLGESPYYRLKVSSITREAECYSTHVLLFASSLLQDSRVQVNSEWLVFWKLDANGSVHSLDRFTILSHSEHHLTGKKKWFRDITSSVFQNDPAYQQHLRRGMPHWLSRIERFAGLSLYSRHGFAVADINGDNLDDIYVCQPGGLPNRLFLQTKDGTVFDGSEASGLDWLDDTRSAIFADFDNDGDQDVVMGTFVGVFLCENQGNGIFRKARQFPNIGRDVSSLSAVDIDNDGRLDIHICVYESEERLNTGGSHGSSVYDPKTKGGRNRLFKNTTAAPHVWSFQEVTESAGMLPGNDRFTFAASWEDFDNDGDQDLYVANDFGKNVLYRNDGRGYFEDVTETLGVTDYGPGMSVSWGDANRDGLPDLYVANMFSAAGNRITPQAEFVLNPEHGTTRESFRRFNKGNSLYYFDGQKFQEQIGSNGAENAQWAWSSILADIDNNGWPDAICANGYISGHGSGDL